MIHRWIGIFFVTLVAVGLVAAQDAPPMPTPNDVPTVAPIGLDQVVLDTVTNVAIYDWWQITLEPDDVIVVEMQAFEGLSPLIGILAPDNELVARSDADRPPEANGLAVIQYRTEVGGLFTISATREGNQAGTTVGAYQLRVRKINTIPERENDLAPVEFRCEEKVATTAVMLAFQEEVPETITDPSGYREYYRVSIYGENDFAPLILADADLVKTGRLDCDNDAGAVVGNTYTLPGEQPVTVTEDQKGHSAQLSLQNSSLMDVFGQVRFTLGSLNAGSGRYFVALEGLKLQDANDIDTLIVRPGPLASQIPLTVYVVGENPGRLDVRMEAYNKDGVPVAACDDAGRKDCADVPAFIGAGATFLYGNTPSIVGDRFDAGLRLPAGSTEPIMIDVSSGDTGTHGAYTVFIIGELPANK
jgi:hypothetical protein